MQPIVNNRKNHSIYIIQFSEYIYIYIKSSTSMSTVWYRISYYININNCQGVFTDFDPLISSSL